MVIALASFGGVVVSNLIPWSDSAQRAGIQRAFGLAIAPFLVGASIVLALLVFPRASHQAHLYVTGAILVALCLVRLAKPSLPNFDREPKLLGTYLFGSLLILWVLALLINAIFIPLTQNDALEYAIVGRELFFARTLDAYPVLNPETNVSGFFGPWTHPPLYVSLIYLTSILQGHVNEPGLMRLIAPWFAIVSICLVAALGRLHGRNTGLMAAIVMLAAPLYFFGVDAALIDALPVLGFLLVFAVVVGFAGNKFAFAVTLGVVLGLALWTHSQAILFVPMTLFAVALRNGRWSARIVFFEWIAILLMAIAIACWPYIRNLQLFGSLVSDNPAVFALPSLAWKDYFTIGRGLDHWVSIVQYGWLKGWFALEAYGLAFWIFLLGVVASHASLKIWWQQKIGRGNSNGEEVYLVPVALGVIGCYLAGVVLSTLLGIDLMIKNERYMLTIIPMVSLIAGSGLSWLLDAVQRKRGIARTVSGLAGVGIVLLLLVQLIGLEGYRLRANGLSLNTLGSRFQETLLARPEIQVVNYLAKQTPGEALVLSMKPADLYYANRRMISYLDPRLLSFYRENDPKKAFQQLKALGVSYVHVVDYGLPVSYNSVLKEVLRNPAMARIEFQADGNQIYALVDSGLQEFSLIDLSPDNIPWQRVFSVMIGGRKALASFGTAEKNSYSGGISEGGLPWGVFHRDTTTALSVGACDSNPTCASAVEVRGNSEYAIDILLSGTGLVRIWVEQFDDAVLLKDVYPRSQSKMLIGEMVLGGLHTKNSYSKRLKMLAKTRYVQLTVEHVGRSFVTIQSANLLELVN